MPLTQEQEEREYELRMEQMLTGIEQARVNFETMRVNAEQMRANTDKLRNDLKYENRKFFVQALVGAAACVGAGIALANYVNSRPQPAPLPPPAPQIIIIPAPAPPARP